MNALSKFVAGTGRVEPTADGWHLHLRPATTYSDAQLDDTRGRPRRDLPHRPPTRLTLEARASSPSPGGTLGFGFWNDPFPAWGGEGGSARLLPASPRALWFFHSSSPSELPFSPNGPATGWTAASYSGPRLPAVLIAALGAAGFAGMAVPRLRAPMLRQYWRWFEGSQSPTLKGLDSWHAYEIDWREDAARFTMDGRVVLETDRVPAGPLGLVIWIDNQWAAISTGAGIRFGVLSSLPESWMEIRSLRIDGRTAVVGR
jgi:hypothetical protein